MTCVAQVAVSSRFVFLVIVASQNLDTAVLLPLFSQLVRVELEALLGPHPFLHSDRLLKPRLDTCSLQDGRVRDGSQNSFVMRARKVLRCVSTERQIPLRVVP